MILLHILLYSAIILLHFLLYFPIRTSGGAKKKMENSKSCYFRILLELAFLKGAKMAAELCISVISYRISENDTNLEFMCESRYGPFCGAQGINLTLSVPTILKSTGG